MPAAAQDWVDGHLDDLLGGDVESAARQVVGAGLTPRVAAPGVALTMDYRPTRVTLVTDGAGAVVRVLAG